MSELEDEVVEAGTITTFKRVIQEMDRKGFEKYLPNVGKWD